MHSKLVLWMVCLLLTATHTTWDLPGTLGEKKPEDDGDLSAECETGEGVIMGMVGGVGGWNQGMGLTKLLSRDLREEYEDLSLSLRKFTSCLSR